MKRAVLVLCVFLFFFSCKKKSYEGFFGGFQDVSDRLQHLVVLLEKTKDAEVSFSIKREIAKELKISLQPKRLVVFLSHIVEEESEGQYSNYFLLMLANEYMQKKMPELAAYYFERIASSKYDLIVDGKSIKLTALNSLIKITEEPNRLISYYSVLLKDFSDKINVAYTFFMLARSYEKVGEWKVAIQTYEKFLSLKDFDVVVQGIPDSFAYAKKIVDYSSSSKNWTVDSLSELIEIIQYALKGQNYALLERYRSKVNFFAMSWKEEGSDRYSKADYTIYNLMYGGNIQVATSVDPSSTPYEVYLRTYGWSHYAKTWYFYLKKINFPADPSIHGRWEWAGIYYGEKL